MIKTEGESWGVAVMMIVLRAQIPAFQSWTLKIWGNKEFVGFLRRDGVKDSGKADPPEESAGGYL